MTRRTPKISIVNGICVRHDAISDAIIGTYNAVENRLGSVPRLYCYACDYPEYDHRIVGGAHDLLTDPHFMTSDVILYHFGIYYDLFNTILAGPPAAKRIVRYHNVTPAKFVAPSAQPVIARSIRQKGNLGSADAIWADSEFNRQDLIEYGIPASLISVQPLFVKSHLASRDHQSPEGRGAVEMLFVGRFVASKGLIDLIDAMAVVNRSFPGRIRLRLAGNTDFSDAGFVDDMRRRIAANDLGEVIDFVGKVDDEALAELYRRADIFVLPSYHEGFCVPLIEAMHARCVPIVYEAGNLPDLLAGFGVGVATGDVGGLAAAIVDLAEQFAAGRPQSLILNEKRWEWEHYDSAVGRYLETFSFDAFSDRVVDQLTSLCGAFEPAQ